MTNEFLLYRVLHHKYQLQPAVEKAMQEGDGEIPVRQMCAKVHPYILERVKDLSDELGISQRRFIEVAVCQAIHEAESLLVEHHPSEGGQS